MKQPEIDNSDNEFWIPNKLRNIDMLFISSGCIVAGMAGIVAEMGSSNSVIGIVLITMGIMDYITSKRFKVIRKD